MYSICMYIYMYIYVYVYMYIYIIIYTYYTYIYISAELLEHDLSTISDKLDLLLGSHQIQYIVTLFWSVMFPAMKGSDLHFITSPFSNRFSFSFFWSERIYPRHPKVSLKLSCTRLADSSRDFCLRAFCFQHARISLHSSRSPLCLQNANKHV